MSENIFGTRLRSADPVEAIAALPTLPDMADEDETAKLLVIPIYQEIAADFQLIGYDNTIRRIEEVLSQLGKQRNVLLYGEAGVGKTAIIQGLVQRKNRGDLSTHMFKRTFDRLNCSRLLHMDDVGEINRQFDQVLEEFGRYDVMVIENVYTLISYLKLKGANAVLIGLLEALSRRKLQVIATCTTREKTLILNEIPEIHEYFAPEKISEPNGEELLNILRGVHRSYEARYAVQIPDSTLCTIRNLTQRYHQGLDGWVQPGRALILLDRGIAQFSVRMNSKSPELAAMEQEIAVIENELQSLDEGPDTPAATLDRQRQLDARLTVLRPQVAKLRAQWVESTAPIQALQTDKGDLDKKLHTWITNRRKWQAMRNDNAALMAHDTDPSKIADNIAQANRIIEQVRAAIKERDDALGKINLSDQRDHVVTSQNISDTFSELSGIPVQQLNEDERERVLQIETILGARVCGQDQALSELGNAVRRDRAGLSADEETPKGSFLFLGPSGVGKTETAKALAEFQTGNEKNIIRLDMSEYKERHTVARMIGAPPGYAGYEDGGVLTNAVREKPKSVILLDEAEKAHPDIFQILLQVCDGGRLTDGSGETIDFRETYIILTSNIGARHFLNEDITFEEAQRLAIKEVEEYFLPEFLGRLDGIICFHRLGVPMLMRVAERRIDKLNHAISTQGLRLSMAPDDVKRFCEVYQNPRYGARPILKAMKHTLERDLATSILEHSNGPGVFHCAFEDRLTMRFEPNA